MAFGQWVSRSGRTWIHLRFSSKDVSTSVKDFPILPVLMFCGFKEFYFQVNTKLVHRKHKVKEFCQSGRNCSPGAVFTTDERLCVPEAIPCSRLDGETRVPVASPPLSTCCKGRWHSVLTCSLYLIGIPHISEHDSSKCPYGYNIHAQTSCFQGRKIKTLVRNKEGFPGGSVVKNLPANAGDAGSVLGLGRSPGRGDDSPLQYSLPRKSHWTEEPARRQSTGLQKSQTWLSD